MQLPDLSTQPRQRRTAALDLGLLLVVTLLLSLTAYAAWRDVARRDRAESRLALVRAETARVHAEAREAPRQGRLMREELLGALMLSIEAPPARVAQALAQHLPAQARIRTLALRYADALLIDMDVTARDAETYDALVEALIASPHFEDLLPGPEAREGEVHSSLSARFVVQAP